MWRCFLALKVLALLNKAKIEVFMLKKKKKKTVNYIQLKFWKKFTFILIITLKI